MGKELKQMLKLEKAKKKNKINLEKFNYNRLKLKSILININKTHNRQLNINFRKFSCGIDLDFLKSFNKKTYKQDSLHYQIRKNLLFILGFSSRRTISQFSTSSYIYNSVIHEIYFKKLFYYNICKHFLNFIISKKYSNSSSLFIQKNSANFFFDSKNYSLPVVTEGRVLKLNSYLTKLVTNGIKNDKLTFFVNKFKLSDYNRYNFLKVKSNYSLKYRQSSNPKIRFRIYRKNKKFLKNHLIWVLDKKIKKKNLKNNRHNLKLKTKRVNFKSNNLKKKICNQNLYIINKYKRSLIKYKKKFFILKKKPIIKLNKKFGINKKFRFNKQYKFSKQLKLHPRAYFRNKRWIKFRKLAKRRFSSAHGYMFFPSILNYLKKNIINNRKSLLNFYLKSQKKKKFYSFSNFFLHIDNLKENCLMNLVPGCFENGGNNFFYKNKIIYYFWFLSFLSAYHKLNFLKLNNSSNINNFLFPNSFVVNSNIHFRNFFNFDSYLYFKKYFYLYKGFLNKYYSIKKSKNLNINNVYRTNALFFSIKFFNNSFQAISKRSLSKKFHKKPFFFEKYEFLPYFKSNIFNYVGLKSGNFNKQESLKNIYLKANLKYKNMTLNRFMSIAKKIYFEKIGILSIFIGVSNNFVTLSNIKGDVIFKSSSGILKLKGKKKRTPIALTTLVDGIIKKVQNLKIEYIYLKVNGLFHTRKMKSVLRSFKYFSKRRKKFKLIKIINVTPKPHNGIRRRKKKRV